MEDHRVVIVGGGFGGLSAARILAGQRGIHVTLVDRRNHHLFQPLLYQVAMAALSPAEIAMPIRAVFSGKENVDVRMGEVTSVDPSQRKIFTDFGELPYDTLVLACGSRLNYFKNSLWEENAPGLKTLEQATEIRRRVLSAFELAERETDPDKRAALMTFVIVGGGPTGVELAGALSEIIRDSLYRDFRSIRTQRARIILIEGGDRVLAPFHPRLSQYAEEDLRKMGVELVKSQRVTQIDGDGVSCGDLSWKAKTVMWAAGVQAERVGGMDAFVPDSSGRIPVDDHLRVGNGFSIYVLGDQCRCVPPGETQPLPGLAPVAMQQGRYVARAILAERRGKTVAPFHYRDKGIMATIGRAKAVVQVGSFRLRGFFAWLTWIFVHIYYLIGFRNRVLVLLNWAWSYLTFKNGARLIVEKTWKSPRH